MRPRNALTHWRRFDYPGRGGVMNRLGARRRSATAGSGRDGSRKTQPEPWLAKYVLTEWNPVFAYAALELGFTAEVCWPYRANEKGSVENRVGWVKGSFCKQRRFHDRGDLVEQLREWLHETNHQRPNRATGEIPEERRQQELERLRPLRTPPELIHLSPRSWYREVDTLHELLQRCGAKNLDRAFQAR